MRLIFILLVVLATQSHAGEIKVHSFVDQPPKKLSFLEDSNVTIAGAIDVKQFIIFSTEGCGPCIQLAAQYPAMRKVGWDISTEPAAKHIRLVNSDYIPKELQTLTPTKYPTTILRVGSKVAVQYTGFLTSQQLLAIWNQENSIKLDAEPVIQTNGHWTFPGNTRLDLIQHLNAEHRLTDLDKLTTEQLLRLHDTAHSSNWLRRLFQ